MATTTTTAGMALGNIPLSTMMVDKDAVVDIVSGEAEEILSGVQEIVDTAVSTAWKAGGSKAPTDLTSALLVAANEGKVYNMSASGTTDSNFMEGAGKPYTAGTDIAVINTGTASSPVYKFNVLAVQDGSVVKSVNNISPVNGNVTIPNADPNQAGLMSVSDFNKLVGISSGAEKNQNAFAKIAVSGVAGTGDAASKTDTLTLVPGNNVTISRNGKSVTIGAQVPSGVVQSFSTDGGNVSPVCGVVDIHGAGGISVAASGGGVVVDGTSLGCGIAALESGLYNLKNFSGVDVYTTSGSTTKTSVTAGSNEATLQIKAGNNVTLAGDNSNKAVTINASVPVKDGKISGGSSLLSGTTIVIPYASTVIGGTHTPGVVKVASGLADSTSGVVPTAEQVSGAISGVIGDVVSIGQGLATKVSGGSLHTALSGSGLANGVGSGSNTIYALINALHSVDGQSES